MKDTTPRVGLNLHNRFDIHVDHGDGTHDDYEAENVVLDVGVQRILYLLGYGGVVTGSFYASAFTGAVSSLPNTPALNDAWRASIFGGCIGLGSGNSTPVASQTALDTPVRMLFPTVFTSTASVDQTQACYQMSISIPAGTGTGETYREIAIMQKLDAAVAGGASTRALIKDAMGSATSIVKGALDVITVTASVYLTISHAYGANLLLTGVNGAGGLISTTSNGLIFSLIGTANTGMNQNAWQVFVGSDATAPAQADSVTVNGGVRTFVTNGSALLTRTVDYANKRVLFQGQVGVACIGTIREFGIGIPYGSAAGIMTLFRAVLPVANEAGSSYNKTAGNVFNVAFYLTVAGS